MKMLFEIHCSVYILETRKDAMEIWYELVSIFLVNDLNKMNFAFQNVAHNIL